MNATWLILGMTILLIGIAVLVPHNSLTGRVVQEGTCKGLGCVELCEQSNTCGSGTVCCSTHWSTGVCDYEVNCEKIREYSLYQTLETYQDGVREQPSPVDPSVSRFIIPLIATVIIIGYFVIKRRDPELQ